MRSISPQFVAVPPFPLPAADHPFLTTALALCRPNHSRSADVLAAAARAGWSPLPTVLPGAQARVKVIDGKPQTLSVFTMPMQLDGGAQAVVHICHVGSTAPIGDLAASVRAAMGRGPTDDSGNFAEWVFTERDGRRAFLPDGSTATMTAALKTGSVEIVHIPSHGLFLMYNEVIGPGASQTEPASSPPSPSFAPPPPVAASSPKVISQPNWVRLPTDNQLSSLYPSKARDRQGSTRIMCKVLKDGTLTDCAIAQEDPKGEGFGRAALASARYFQMAPTTTDGKPVEGGMVVIPIHWVQPAPE